MEHWWNNTDRGKLKYLEKILLLGQFVHHKSNIDWPGIEPVSAMHVSPALVITSNSTVNRRA
jgi:hypothetical protein